MEKLTYDDGIKAIFRTVRNYKEKNPDLRRPLLGLIFEIIVTHHTALYSKNKKEVSNA